MTPQNFLRSKRMLADETTTFMIVGTFGHVDLVELLDEYAALKLAPGEKPATVTTEKAAPAPKQKTKQRK